MEQTSRLQVSDGETLLIRRFTPDRAPQKGTFLHIHGFSEYSGRFSEHWANLANRGFRVLTFDHRGHGESTGQRFVVAPWERLISDVKEVIGAEKAFLGKTYGIFGHSMGGNLTASCVLKNVIHPKSVILSAPAFAAGPAIPLWAKVLSPLISKLLPNLVLTPTYDEGVLTSIPEEREKVLNDPLFNKRTSPTNYVRIFLEAGRWNLEHAGQWKLPLLMMYGAKDPLTKPSAMKFFFEQASGSPKEIWIDSESHHELLFDIHAKEAMERIEEWFTRTL